MSSGSSWPRKREAEHPADTIPIYQGRIEAAVSNGGNQGHEDAVHLLTRLRDLYTGAGKEPSDFVEYVARLRSSYWRKRNFIKLLGASSL
ncbi:MAG: hypothetical protein ACJ8GN_04970 [Longimicrobiaceae bacterium]